MEDRRCLECSRHFSTTQALASHVKTHKSLNLALSVTSSPLSQSLPPDILAPTTNSTVSAYLEVPSQQSNTNATSAQVSSAPSVSAPPCVNAAALLTATPQVVSASPGAVAPPQCAAAVVTALVTAASPTSCPPVASSLSNSTFSEPASQTDSSQTTFTCDICSRSLKTKSALIKHRVCLSCLICYIYVIFCYLFSFYFSLILKLMQGTR